MKIHEKHWFWLVVIGFVLLLIALGRYAIKKSADGWVHFTLWTAIILMTIGTILGIMDNEDTLISEEVATITSYPSQYSVQYSVQHSGQKSEQKSRHLPYQHQQEHIAEGVVQSKYAPAGSGLYPPSASKNSVGYSVVSKN